MPARLRRSELGAARGRTIVGELMREARESRFGYGLSQDDVARAIGMSRSRYSRIERGLVPTVSLVTAAEMLAVVGLDLSVRTYPSGEPIRDAAHAALLERLRRLLHGSLRWRTEVPLPDPRERRAWDAVVSGRDAIGLWQMGVEAETRPRDLQALERRLALKERDGGVDAVLLLLSNSRHNRSLVRDHPSLRDRFSSTQRRTLSLLGPARDPKAARLSSSDGSRVRVTHASDQSRSSLRNFGQLRAQPRTVATDSGRTVRERHTHDAGDARPVRYVRPAHIWLNAYARSPTPGSP